MSLKAKVRAQKARDRAARATSRDVGTVISVSGTTALVSLGLETIPAVVPASVAGVVTDATVVVRRRNSTPEVEAVLATSWGAGYTYLPGGVLLCWTKVSITPSAALTSTPVVWTFPAAFSSPPALSAVAESVNETVQEVTVYAVTPTQAEIRLVRSNTTATPVHCIAIGPA